MNQPDIPASSSFATFDQRAQRGEPLTVAFLGGSLTWGAQATDPLKTSYRARVSQALCERYPDARFTFVDAAIGGTGSQLAAFRLQRDVLAYEPDLVFLDFTINDGETRVPTDDRLSAYESLVRRMVKEGALVVQVILPIKADAAATARNRPLDALHKAIGDAYHLPQADAVALLRTKVDAGQVAGDELWDLPYDSTHPGDAGYALYAEAAWGAYLKAVEEGAACRLPSVTLHSDHYMTVDRFELAGLENLPNGWGRGVPHRNAIAFDFVCSRWMEDLAIANATAEAAPESLVIRFTGQSVLLFGESTQKSGRYAVSVDGGDFVEYNAHCRDGNMRLVQTIAHGLDPDKAHALEIRPLLNEGEELRLNSICVAGGAVIQ